MTTKSTEVTIDGAKFQINGAPTYRGRSWKGHPVEGLLLNTRMVQGIFDDLNPETRDDWAYADTGSWDADRNTEEFIAAMPSWKAHGVLAFTINLQGGSPYGYSKQQPWINSAFTPEGALRDEYLDRLSRILRAADELGMVPSPATVGGCGLIQHFASPAACIQVGMLPARCTMSALGTLSVWVPQSSACALRRTAAGLPSATAV